jgi:hypothetical protein
MFIEVYPDDHPFLVESFSEQDHHKDGDATITKLVNPFAGQGALIGFGRGCMRFMLDVEGVADFIEYLTDIKLLLEDMNDETSSLHTSDEPLRISLVDIPGFRHEDKRLDDRFEVGNIRSGPEERRTIENIRLHIAESAKPEEDK